MARARSTEQAVTETASLHDARAAAGATEAAGARAGGPGTADPLLGDLRRAGLLPLLVLSYLVAGPSYGHELMDRIRELTDGLIQVNPNTMYPLLRSLEGRALIAGEWEHPERRSRRFYRITARGLSERDRLLDALAPRLEQVVTSVESIRSWLGAAHRPAPGKAGPHPPAPGKAGARPTVPRGASGDRWDL